MKRLGLALALLGFFFATAAPIRQVGQSTTQPASYTHVDLLAMPDSVLTGTTTVNASTAVTGTNTLFLSEVHVGDRISVSSAASTYATVTAIASNISLTVSAVLGDGTSQTINVKHAIWRALNAAGTPVAIQNDLGSLILQRQSLGTTSTDGLVLENTTAAAAGAQQISSRVRWTGRGWETDTGSSQQTDYIAQLVPVQGAAAPQARLDFNYAINSGALQATPTMSLLNGNVGIGIINPVAKMEVEGDARFGATMSAGGKALVTSDTVGNSVSLTNTVNSEMALTLAPYSGITTVKAGGNVLLSATDPTGIITFKTNNIEYARINSNGNIGIAQTTFGASAAKVLSFGGPATPPTTRPPDAFTLYPFDVNGAGTMGLAWMSEDNGIGIIGSQVGIGTTAPEYKLDIWGSAWDNTARIYSTGSNGGLDFFDSNGTRRGIVYSDANGFGLLGSNGAWTLRIPYSTNNAVFENGNVGIGTATFPTAATKVAIFDSTQLSARIGLTGQEFWEAANTSIDGLAFVLGVNRASNRQLWIGDTAALAKNTTNTVLRFVVGGTGMPTIDAISTDSTTTKLFALGNASGIQYGKALVALGGGAAPTLGTIGGSGPTAAAQNAWIQMRDSTGANVWIAVWK